MLLAGNGQGVDGGACWSRSGASSSWRWAPEEILIDAFLIAKLNPAR